MPNEDSLTPQIKNENKQSKISDNVDAKREIEQKKKYRQYGLGMIISGVGLLVLGFFSFLGVLLLGGGIITFVTNLDWNKK